MSQTPEGGGHHAPDGRLAEAESQPFDFAGWGVARRITDLEPVPPSDVPVARPHQLGEWRATALCGNDITSSVLYVPALCAAQAGVLAPVVLLVVSGVLYLFRKVYAEVGSALPLNGGSYTVLLNTTSKRVTATLGGEQEDFLIDRKFVESTGQLERLHPLVERGGYLPCVDHRVPPDVTYENYLYYLQKKKAIL